MCHDSNEPFSAVAPREMVGSAQGMAGEKQLFGLGFDDKHDIMRFLEILSLPSSDHRTVDNLFLGIKSEGAVLSLVHVRVFSLVGITSLVTCFHP